MDLYTTKRLLFMPTLLATVIMTACTSARPSPSNRGGPIISGLTASSTSFSIDCPPTFVTVSAHVIAPVELRKVQVWYRIGGDQPYAAMDMTALNGRDYGATIKGSDLPPGPYGPLQMYVAAADTSGARSQTVPIATVQFLPCVSH